MIRAILVFFISLPFIANDKASYGTEKKPLDVIKTLRSEPKTIKNVIGEGITVAVTQFKASNFIGSELPDQNGGVSVEGSYITMEGKPYLTDFRVIKTLGNNQGITGGLEESHFFGFKLSGLHYDEILIFTDGGVFLLKPNAGEGGVAQWYSKFQDYSYKDSVLLNSLKTTVEMSLSKALEPAGGAYSPLIYHSDEIQRMVREGKSFSRDFSEADEFINLVRTNYGKGCDHVFRPRLTGSVN